MGDEIEITLPVSGKKVVIRNYTTYSDDFKAETILKEGVYNEQQTIDGELQVTSKYPQINLSRFARSYVDSLVKSIDSDSSDLASKLDQLRSADYAAVSKAVDKVCTEQSPKQTTVSNDSDSDTVQS